MPTGTFAAVDVPTPNPPKAQTASEASFALLRIVALGLVVIAAFVMLALLFASRRRDDNL